MSPLPVLPLCGRTRVAAVLVVVVASLLLQGVTGEECARGFPSSDTIDMYGSSSMSEELPSTARSMLYVIPSMNFSCDGTITDIRMRLEFVEGLQPSGQSQVVIVYFILLHDGLNSPNRSVTHISLDSTNIEQYHDVAAGVNTEIFHARSLSLPVTEGTFIGFAVPANDTIIFGKNINLSPEPSDRVEAHLYQIASPFSEFEGRVLEAARTGDVCQFSTQMIALPLIDVSFSPSSATLPPSSPDSTTGVSPSPTPHSNCAPFSSTTPSISTNLPSPSTEATPSPGLSQLVTIVIAVVVSAVLLLVVVVILVVVMVAIVCRRRIKDEHDFERYRKDNELEHKPVAASFTAHSGIHSEATIGRVSIGSPAVSEGAGSQEALHSPTTGQLTTGAGDDGITYAVPTVNRKQETDSCKTPPTYDTAYHEPPLFVPTMDEREKYASTDGLSDHYALPSMKPEGSLHYEFPSTESEHYWSPANNEVDLYRQLSQHKYQEIPRSTVIQDGQIGEGEFGVVCRGEWQNKAGVVQQVAIKMLHNEDDRTKFLQEAAAMGQFNHPNVARLFGVVTVGKPAMIVLELLEKGDLRSYLLTVDPSQHPNLTSLLLKFSRQIADGMAHLSSKDFIHRDLATRNILLDTELNCKIADFGMSRDLTNEYYLSQGGRIPLKWTAPEALLYHKYSTGSDVWSYGMVLFEIWSLGHKPFEEETAEQLVEMFSTKNGYCQAPPPGCPREVYAVMVECWNPDHHKRPNFDEVFTSLGRPEPVLTSFGEESDLESIPPTALVLGSSLDAANHLYLDLQHTYKKKK